MIHSRQNFYLSSLLFLAVIFLYARTLKYDFAYDDIPRIVENERVNNNKDLFLALRKIFTEPTYPGDLYRPIPEVIYKVIKRKGNLKASYFHFLNIAFFLIFITLALKILYDFSQNFFLSFLSIFLFSIHPLNVEIVSNINSSSEILAGIFGLFSIIFSEKFFEKNNTKKTLNLFTTIIFLLLACLSKESGILFFLIIPLYLVFKRNISILKNKRLVLFVLCTSIAPLIYLVLRTYVLGENALISNDSPYYWAENPLLGVDLKNRLFASLVYLGKYLQHILLPFNLSVDYSLSFFDFWGFIFSITGFLNFLLFLLFCFCLYFSRRQKEVFYGIWYLIFFLLTSNIFLTIGTIMGDRLAFLPSLGAITFFVFLASHLSFFKKRYFKVMLTVYAASLIFISHKRIPIWTNSYSVLESAVLDNPLSTKSLVQLGNYWRDKGKKYNLAKEYYVRALKIDPLLIQAMLDFAHYFLLTAQPESGFYWCDKVLEIDPGNETAILKKQALVDVKGHLEEAERE